MTKKALIICAWCGGTIEPGGSMIAGSSLML